MSCLAHTCKCCQCVVTRHGSTQLCFEFGPRSNTWRVGENAPQKCRGFSSQASRSIHRKRDKAVWVVSVHSGEVAIAADLDRLPVFRGI